MGILLRVAGLLAVYLLVLTSVAPGDILIGSLLAIALVAAARPRDRRPEAGWLSWARAVARMFLDTAVEIVVGTVRTVRFSLGWAAAPGFVEIPRDDRSRREVALWGVLTGESPDEYPVDVDESRQVLIVHTLDARDVAAVRARHARGRDRSQRHVVR
jgi:multisubunit Na+/H+ antiporter MnhE subunit